LFSPDDLILFLFRKSQLLPLCYHWDSLAPLVARRGTVNHRGGRQMTDAEINAAFQEAIANGRISPGGKPLAISWTARGSGWPEAVLARFTARDRSPHHRDNATSGPSMANTIKIKTRADQIFAKSALTWQAVKIQTEPALIRLSSASAIPMADQARRKVTDNPDGNLVIRNGNAWNCYFVQRGAVSPMALTTALAMSFGSRAPSNPISTTFFATISVSASLRSTRDSSRNARS